MRAFVTAGGGFLLAVLWFDLMFDIQVRRHHHAQVPNDVMASISAYYRRVTTDARPMNRVVALAMLATLAAIVKQITSDPHPEWIGWVSLALAAPPILLATARTFPNAVRLGRGSDPPEVGSRLARAIYRDHCFCLLCIATLVVLQLATK